MRAVNLENSITVDPGTSASCVYLVARLPKDKTEAKIDDLYGCFKRFPRDYGTVAVRPFPDGASPWMTG